MRYTKVEYPCGFKFETFVLFSYTINHENFECPLHDKKCSKKVKV